MSTVLSQGVHTETLLLHATLDKASYESLNVSHSNVLAGGVYRHAHHDTLCSDCTRGSSRDLQSTKSQYRNARGMEKQCCLGVKFKETSHMTQAKPLSHTHSSRQCHPIPHPGGGGLAGRVSLRLW